MDAYGNLTSQDEFANGRRIRLISYLGPDLALGAPAQMVNGPLNVPCVEGSVSLHHLSAGDPAETVLIANAVSGGFSLSPSGAPTAFLVATDPLPPTWSAQPISLMAPEVADEEGGPPAFAVQFVESCWFTIGPPGTGMVFDVREGATDEGTQVSGFTLNGGQNQIWRAEVVQEELGATARPGPPPPLTRLPSVAGRPWWAARLIAFFDWLFGRPAADPADLPSRRVQG